MKKLLYRIKFFHKECLKKIDMTMLGSVIMVFFVGSMMTIGVLWIALGRYLPTAGVIDSMKREITSEFESKYDALSRAIEVEHEYVNERIRLLEGQIPAIINSDAPWNEDKSYVYEELGFCRSSVDLLLDHVFRDLNLEGEGLSE